MEGVREVGGQCQALWADNDATASGEAIAPVPPVILDNFVGFGLDPPIERDERQASNPTGDMLGNFG